MIYHKEARHWEGIREGIWPAIARQLPAARGKPKLRSRRKGGRPRLDDRLALSAILWRLRCGGTWNAHPRRFGSAATARRRLEFWLRAYCLEKAWRAYLVQLNPFELDCWKEALDARTVVGLAYWRFGLEQVWRMEFAPYLQSGRGHMA